MILTESKAVKIVVEFEDKSKQTFTGDEANQYWGILVDAYEEDSDWEFPHDPDDIR